MTKEETHKASIVSSSSIHRENSLPTLNVANYLHPIAGPTLSLKPVVKRLSSSFIASTTNCEPPVIAPAIPKKKRRKKSETPESPSSTVEASPSDVASMCASYSTVADLVADHRRRMAVKHDVRELEARPDLLLVPIDQLAIVYERERTRESLLSAQSCSSSMTTVVKLCQSTDLIALPFIDCPLEFDFLLDELVVQQLWIYRHFSLLSKCTNRKIGVPTVLSSFLLFLLECFCMFVYLFFKKKERKWRKIILFPVHSSSDWFTKAISSRWKQQRVLGDFSTLEKKQKDVLSVRSEMCLVCERDELVAVFSEALFKTNEQIISISEFERGKKRKANWTKCYHNANGWKGRKTSKRNRKIQSTVNYTKQEEKRRKWN